MNSSNNTQTGTQRRLPGKVSLTVSAFLSCFFTVGAVLALDALDFLTSAVMFIAASAVFSFLLIFVRHFFVFAVPVISAAVCVLLGADISFTVAVCCGVAVFAVVYTLCHLKLFDSFKQFLITALTYSVAGGAVFCILLDIVYGSVGEGIVAFGNKIASMAPVIAQMAESNGMDYDSIFSILREILGTVHVYIPAMIFSLGVMCAWLMRGFFSMYTRVSGISSLFNGRQSSAPKAFAGIFLVTSFFAILFSVLPDSIFYGISNIRSILSIILMGEGLRLYFASFSHRAKKRAGVSSVIGTVLLLMFFPAVIPVILPYYGAFIILFSRGSKQ